MSDFDRYMLQVRRHTLEAQRLLEYLRSNSEFPREFILPKSCSGYNFRCRLIRPVTVDDCEITELSISYPLDVILDGGIETALFGPDERLVYPRELGYADVYRHESDHDLLNHVCDLAQKLFFASG